MLEGCVQTQVEVDGCAEAFGGYALTQVEGAGDKIEVGE